MLGGLARKSQLQRQRPGSRRQHYIWPIQYTTCSAGDIDAACSTLARPVTEKKELALPRYRREIASGEKGNKRTDRPADYPLFFNSEPVPARRPVAALESLSRRCQLIDDFDDIGIADSECQMVGHCSRSSQRIAAIAVAKQGEGTGRRDIARDAGATARHQLYRSSNVVRDPRNGLGQSGPRIFDHNEEGSAGFDESRPEATAGLTRSHHCLRGTGTHHPQRNLLQRVSPDQFGWPQCPPSNLRADGIAPFGKTPRQPDHEIKHVRV